ncbi:Hsp20/alpha crystallin family protein [Curtobacterium sp. PhB115]|uniref:Hsp20/alpha crystallin family protein n=1 Tax=Curtobacterium sp. PhB115 TaxID=2485173 RepID=UPI000F4B2F99|nr:Hsp20/alpha crystallin family protein [Curtobacterium sp. PhB115]ROP58671.1 HSP20 family protein [Curtobacterium sp. PhB115]
MVLYFDPFRELDRLTATMFDGRSGPRFVPMDLSRDGDHYILNADMPGVDPGSIDIDVEGSLLTIRAHRTLSTSESAKWLSQERPSGAFVRQLNLGEGIDAEKISANYENGVLSVVLPVSERAKPRRIPITGSAAPEPVAVTAGAAPAETSTGTDGP